MASDDDGSLADEGEVTGSVDDPSSQFYAKRPRRCPHQKKSQPLIWITDRFGSTMLAVPASVITPPPLHSCYRAPSIAPKGA